MILFSLIEEAFCTYVIRVASPVLVFFYFLTHAHVVFFIFVKKPSLCETWMFISFPCVVSLLLCVCVHIRVIKTKDLASEENVHVLEYQEKNCHVTRKKEEQKKNLLQIERLQVLDKFCNQISINTSFFLRALSSPCTILLCSSVRSLRLVLSKFLI